MDFFAEAEHDIKNGKYNLALFHLEQALQSAPKHALFQLKGGFTKTHDVLRLLDEIIELTRSEKLRRIRNEEASTLEAIRPYITSRYLPFDADRPVVERAYNVVKAILNELGLVE